VTIYDQDICSTNWLLSTLPEQLKVLTRLALCLHSLETTPCLDPVGGNRWILILKRL
jgi:hypothetical protein